MSDAPERKSVLEYLRSIEKEADLRALVERHVDPKDVDSFMAVIDEPNNEPLDFAAAERVCAFSRVNRVAVKLYKELILFFVNLGYKLKKERGQKTKLFMPPPVVEKEKEEQPAGEGDPATATLASEKRFNLRAAVEEAFTYTGEGNDGFKMPAGVAAAIGRDGITPDRVYNTLEGIATAGEKSGTLVFDQRRDHGYRLRRTRKWYQVRRMQIPESVAQIPAR